MIDREMTEMMTAAKKGCRKLWSGHYEYSPEVQQWIDKCHVYK